jgi:hypothetical protein
MNVAWPWTATQVIAAVFACGGVCFFFHGLLRLFRRNPEARWHKVRGKIITSEIDFSDEIYRAKIRYIYEFDGTPREGKGIAPIEAWSSFRSTAAHFINKYPIAQDVWVYVNPASPGCTVLEPQQQPIAAITEMLMGIAVGGSGCLGWLTSSL